MKTLILIFFLILVLPACAHDSAIRVRPDSAVTMISENDSVGRTLEAGSVFELKDEVTRFSAPGKIPVYVVRPTGVEKTNQNPIRLSLPSEEEWKPTQTDSFITRKMDELYIELFQILRMAKQNKPGEALIKAQSIVRDYPKLASAYYVKAQIEILLSHPQQAVASLDAALKIKPEFQEALQLKNRIQKGGQP